MPIGLILGLFGLEAEEVVEAIHSSHQDEFCPTDTTFNDIVRE